MGNALFCEKARMNPFVFLVVALAVARISLLLVDERGPYAVLERLRYLVGIRYDHTSERYSKHRSGFKHEVAELFLCVWCMSMWLGIAAATFTYLWPDVAFWLALPFAFSFFAVVFKERLT